MFRYLKHKVTHLVFTLRFSLLSIFITLFAASMLTIFGAFYFHLSDLVVRAAYLIIDRESYAIINNLNIHLLPIEDADKFTSELVGEKILDIDDIEEVEDYLVHFVRRFALVSAAYWGDVNGNFIYAHKEENGNIRSAFVNLQAKPAKEIITYRDKNERKTQSVGPWGGYDPRNRPWFQMAVAQKKSTWTDVYSFGEAKPKFGVTISTPAYDRQKKLMGVFGMDVELDYLSKYVATHKIREHGEVFIVDEHGSLIASPRLLDIDYSKGPMKLSKVSASYDAAFHTFQRNKQDMFVFENNGEDYIAAFRKIPLLAEHGWYIGIIDPEADFTHPIRAFEFIYFFIDLAIFILGILLISGFVTRIVRPIKKLVKETEKIKEFDLNFRDRIRSRIKEVVELSDAIYSMKMGLRSFKKYVPSGLVRQLVSTGEDARAGGIKRDLVVFFSDIKNFTTISEKANSNQLVQQICDYLEALSSIIIQDNGTIDKYIGDSVMAFWGAPAVIQNPCQHAASAALRCLNRSQQLNIMWQSRGQPAFITRIGLHYGEAIVGNIGSSERLNYTALGDMVNIASRLVSANKVYGTSILVSDSFYHQLKDVFVLRFVDQVRFKGKAGSIAIYELLAENKQELSFDIDAYRRTFMEAFLVYQQQKWQEAITGFDLCLQVYAQDNVAPVFIKRCKQLQEKPPATTWDGIWHVREK